MNNYVKTMIHQMARRTGTVLTSDHYKILDYTHRYYQRHRVGPLYLNVKKQVGVSKSNIDRLFPHGLQSVYTWLGIPIHSIRRLCKPIPEIRVEDYREVYLDHNATTYPREEIIELLNEYNQSLIGFGNPSSSTDVGRRAYQLVESARERIADCLKVDPGEIVFTGGGSEANNLALKGIAFQNLEQKGHFITSKVEHPSVLRSMEFLQEMGFDVTYLDVDSEGRISPRSVRDHLRDDTLLVSVMAANNEIGTINPIEEIGDICRLAGVPFMVDAVQAFGRIPLKPHHAGISLMSISGHKIYGPKGVGALFIDKSKKLTPLIHGGKQEHGLRAGTENVGAINAFGRAAELILAEREKETHRLLGIREFFLTELRRIIPETIVHGCMEHRIPHNLSIGFPYIDSGALLLSLNQIGVFVSAGSACSSGNSEPSHVLRAIGADTEKYGTVRFSFGLRTSEDDLSYLFRHLPMILYRLRVEKREYTINLEE